MAHSKAVAGLLILALASGCAAVTSRVSRALRSPGERIETFPEQVWSEYRCSQRKLPFFKIEELELYPQKLTPGERFNHRFIYSLCPVKPTAVITGRLETSILFKGKAIVREANDSYDLKPGRWVVDTFVTLPAEANPGLYGLQLKFKGQNVKFQRTLSFTVSAGAGT
ncbi:MAG: hypothetical protein V3T14_02705 [Myxococcota bacterium]